jgi:hypothetical protein
MEKKELPKKQQKLSELAVYSIVAGILGVFIIIAITLIGVYTNSSGNPPIFSFPVSSFSHSYPHHSLLISSFSMSASS